MNGGSTLKKSGMRRKQSDEVEKTLFCFDWFLLVPSCVPPNAGHQSRLEGLCSLGGAVSREPIQQLHGFLFHVQSVGFSIRADGICRSLGQVQFYPRSNRVVGGSTSFSPPSSSVPLKIKLSFFTPMDCECSGEFSALASTRDVTNQISVRTLLYQFESKL